MDVWQFLTWALFETGINCALFLCKLRWCFFLFMF
jgi:hypothetical protein